MDEEERGVLGRPIRAGATDVRVGVVDTIRTPKALASRSSPKGSKPAKQCIVLNGLAGGIDGVARAALGTIIGLVDFG
jgi:hypothetical protein